MKTTPLLLFFSILFLVMEACGGASKDNASGGTATPATTPKSMVEEAPSYDPVRGEGKFNAENVKIGALDATMASKGEGISKTKCLSCHKMTDERLVGPGWKGVTTRRQPFWIMNFITNPDPMINKDPAVQAQLELCLVRMPNQSLTDDDARNVLEYMRKNDGVQ
ncbi:MAG: cytochrome c [Sphingobacteriales bacterium]|nr:cytochrome c [Sphingobacteriales bacterium]